MYRVFVYCSVLDPIFLISWAMYFLGIPTTRSTVKVLERHIRFYMHLRNICVVPKKVKVEVCTVVFEAGWPFSAPCSTST